MPTDFVFDSFGKEFSRESLDSFQNLGLLDSGQSGEYRPFLQSNELIFPHTFTTLELHRNKYVSTLHVGVSGLQNLDMMAARKSNFGILIDINQNMHKVMNIVRDMFRMDPPINRHEFTSVFTQIVSAQAEFWPDKEGKDYELDNFVQKSHESWSWLSSEESYNHIRKLFLQNRILSVNLNFADVSNIEKISHWANQFGINVDTIYISNIFEWNMDENANKLKSLAVLGQDETVVLSSYDQKGELTVFDLRDHPHFIIDRKNSIASLGGGLKESLGMVETEL